MIHTISNSLMAVNTYIISDAESCLVIDPSDNGPYLVNWLTSRNLSPESIILTHSHLDHTAGLNPLKKAFSGCRIYIHEKEASFLGEGSRERHRDLFARMGGEQYASAVLEEDLPDPSGFLIPGETIHGMKIIFTPGHTKGGCCFYNEDESILFAGDTLFRMSIGRTDLPGGNHSQLISSIRGSLLTLPPKTRVLTGHGEETTVEFERLHNPYLAE